MESLSLRLLQVRVEWDVENAGCARRTSSLIAIRVRVRPSRSLRGCEGAPGAGDILPRIRLTSQTASERDAIALGSELGEVEVKSRRLSSRDVL